jgi:hypothetical protein
MFLLYTYASYMESRDKCSINAVGIGAELGKGGVVRRS